MKIYKDYLNELNCFSVSNNAYENEENFRNFQHYIRNIINETFYLNKALQINCLRAIYTFCRPDNEYVIHKFKDYYAISRIKDNYTPIEIDEEIQVFDKDKVYPLQEIEIVLDFKY